MISPLSEIFSDSSFLLSTIDADIANIPTNEFRSVFTGGLVVIAGGFLSAFAVGAILEASDGYAAVVAESYDLEADEEFWKGLSEEEAKKAREMLQKVKQQRGETIQVEATSVSTEMAETKPSITTPSTPSATQDTPETTAATTTASAGNKSVDMFSDY